MCYEEVPFCTEHGNPHDSKLCFMMIGGRGLCMLTELQYQVLEKALCATRRVIMIWLGDKCLIMQASVWEYHRIKCEDYALIHKKVLCTETNFTQLADLVLTLSGFFQNQAESTIQDFNR